MQRLQAILPADYDKRVQFCREMLHRNSVDPQFFNNILCSDESTFVRTGIFNIHNLHYWDCVNPRVVKNDHFQHQFGVNMWAGIVEGKLIGPFELPRRPNSEEYLIFLQNELGGLLHDVSLETHREIWLQCDGAFYSLCPRSETVPQFTIRKSLNWKGRYHPVATKVT